MNRKIFGSMMFLLLLLPLISLAFKPIMEISLTPEKIALWAGAVLSWVFSYFPGLNTWYAGKTEDFKKLFMIILLAVVVITLYGLMCFNVITISSMVCSTDSLSALAYLWIMAVTSNQALHRITPELSAVKKAKE